MSQQRGCYGASPERPKTLGERIKAVRMSWGWTQKQLAEALSSNPKTVWHWEKGRQAPSEAALGSLVGLFGLSREALVSGKGFEAPDPPRMMAGILIADSYANDMVVLPPGEPDHLVCIDKETGDHKAVTLTRTIEMLRAARADHRPVWVVIGATPKATH